MADKPTKLKNKETAFRSNEELIKQVEARIKKGNKVNQEESMQYIKAKGLKDQDLLDFYDRNMSQGFSMKNPSKWEREELDPNYKAPTTDADIKNWKKYNTGVESMKADSVPSELKKYLLNTGFAESKNFGAGDTLEGKRIYTRAKSVGINPEMDAEGNFKLADDVNTFKDTDKTFGKTRTINPKAKYVKKVYTKGNDIVNNYELAVPPTYEGKVPTEQELKDFDAGTFYQVGANSQYKKVYVPYLDPKKVPQDGDASTINANNQEMVNRYNTAQSYADQIGEYKKTDKYKAIKARREAVAPVKKAFNDIKNYEFKILSDKDLDALGNGGTITTPREDMYANGGMIKRADGSYSKRGLWDNIRANKGSGKEPTKEMLKQERKINAKYANGGITNPGFNALPKEIQQKILAKMANGGNVGYDEYVPEFVSKETPMPRFGKGGYLPMHADGDYIGAPAMPQANFNIQNPNQVTPGSFRPNTMVPESSGYNRNVMPINTNVVGIGRNAPMANTLNNSTTSEIMQTGVNRGKVNINPETGNPVGGVNSLITPGNIMLARGASKLAYGVGKDIAKSAANAIGSVKHHGKHFGAEEAVSHGYDHLTHMLSGNHGAIPEGVMYNNAMPSHANGGRVLPRFYKGGSWKGTDASGNAIKTNFAGSTAGENVVTGAGIAGAAVPMLTSFIPDDEVRDSEGNVLGSEVSLGKGILNSAAQGASMGAAAGPWGAAIGAGVGAIYGGITTSMANDDVRRERDEANRKINSRNITNSVMTNKNMYSTNTSNNDQMIAANGGTVIDEDMGNPNAELELNETFRDPMTGETGMVDGPSHDNGGIEMSLAEGTQIWSDRLKHNGRTFASLTKPIINKIAVLEKGTKDNPNSRFKQNSIQLLNSQLDFFFDKQESNKQQDEMKRTLKKQEGGVVDDMGNYHYANGGIYIKPENRGKFTAYKERTGKTTEEALHSPNAHVRQMANFAKNAAGWKHAMGGMVQYDEGGPVIGSINPSTGRAYTMQDIFAYNQGEDLRPHVSGQLSGDTYTGGNINLGETTRNFALNNSSGEYNNPFYSAKVNYANNTLNNQSPTPTSFQMSRTGNTNLPATGAGPGGVNPALFNKANYSNGDYYMNHPTPGGGSSADVTAAYEKQRSLDAASQNPNAGQGYFRNNKGELIQAGALAGSAFTQLNNINRLAAPGVRPDIRLTGAIPNPRYVDLSAERGAINRSAMNAMGEAQRGFGNSATAQAFKNKARINQLEGAGRSYQNQENMNTDISNKFAAMRGEAGMKEALANSEIANANLENRFNFAQSKMRGQNAAIATLGHGVGDIGRNITTQRNDMEKANVLSNQYEDSVLADTYKRNPQLLEDAYKNGQISKNKYDQIKNTPKAKYGGTVKTRSLKY